MEKIESRSRVTCELSRKILGCISAIFFEISRVRLNEFSVDFERMGTHMLLYACVNFPSSCICRQLDYSFIYPCQYLYIGSDIQNMKIENNVAITSHYGI